MKIFYISKFVGPKLDSITDLVVIFCTMKVFSILEVKGVCVSNSQKKPSFEWKSCWLFNEISFHILIFHICRTLSESKYLHFLIGVNNLNSPLHWNNGNEFALNLHNATGTTSVEKLLIGNWDYSDWNTDIYNGKIVIV